PYNAIITSFAGFAVAGISELLQLPIFTDSRGAAFTDVLIDFSGYALGGALTIAALMVIHLIISRRRASASTDK
ncbi:MAG: hypothetical protein ILP02_03015, partial [Clostridia bacterium]|nr:hypothetical protein [Clostridia bacterium]